MMTVSKISPIEYLGYPQFVVTLMLAVLLHLSAAIIWYMSPHIRIVDIPVRAINIRLGDSDVQEQQQVQDDEDAPQPELSTSKQVDDAMTKLIRHPITPKVEKKPVVPQPPPPKPPEAAPKPAPVNDNQDTPRQFVRFMPNRVDDKVNGSVLGNSVDSNSDIKSRYEQTISLWIQKFKLYPESARSQGIQGRTVVRIRIDRRGNIRYSVLEDTTGSPELDRAALDMVRRANPVPAVPDNYVDGEMFEFLIPVKFQIQ